MAALPQLTRAQLMSFLPNEACIRAYEQLQRALINVPDDLPSLAASAAAAQADIDAHEALTSAHGVTGDIVGTEGAQTLADKTMDGPVLFTTQTVSTGAAAPVLTANKPGASTAIAGWWAVTLDGTDYVIPLYMPT